MQGEVHLAKNFTLSAPEFSMVINGYSTLDGGVDYDVHSDLVHRSLFGEVINLAEELPLLGTVLRHINPFHLIHRHLELSATVQGNVFRLNAAGQPDVHVSCTLSSSIVSVPSEPLTADSFRMICHEEPSYERSASSHLPRQAR